MHTTQLLKNKWGYVKYMMLFAFIISLIASCTKKYSGYNTDPYKPTAQMLEADGYSTGKNFPDMFNAVTPAGDVASGTDFVNQYQLAYSLAGDVFSGFMGQAGDWAGNSNNLTYNFIPGWINQEFNLAGALMAAWKNVKNVTDISGDSLQFSVAQIIKIAGMSKATDMYGPIPYSALESGSFTPAYDAQDKIYYSMLTELSRAVGILSKLGAAGGKPLAKYDMIYGGDYLKWARFGNSLKLRLAMRIVYADRAKAQQYAEEAINSPAGVMSAKADNALYQKGGTSFNFKNPLRTLCEDYLEARMGASMQSILYGYNDSRIAVYFRPSSLPGHTAEYVGIRAGIAVVRSAYQPFSYLNVTNETPMPWMTAAEVYFLRAEGALRGWNMGGTAKDLYESGIKASFDETGAALPAGYLSNNTSKPANYVDYANNGNNAIARSTITIQWNDAAGFEESLERIITQKWIGLYPNGQEAWSEFRRTGYPKIFPIALDRSGGTVDVNKQVRRLPYPLAQYQQNSAQVQKGVALLGGPDIGKTNLWWDKK